MNQDKLPLPNPGDWLSGQQAARVIGIGRGTLYDLMNAGKIHSYRIGAFRVFWRSEIEAYRDARNLVGGRGRGHA
jgi:excisionase family DNA binding protein